MIEKFLEEALRSKSELTRRTYGHALQQFQTWLEGSGADLTCYSRSDVQQYLDFLVARRKSPSTIHKIYASIRKYSIWAKMPQCIEDIRLIKSPQKYQLAPKALDRLEKNRVLREVDRENDPRNTAIVITLLNTGLRVSELVNLDLEDLEISDRKGSLIVRMGKGYKSRMIPLNNEARRAIVNYLAIRNSEQKALFISNRGVRISVRTVQHLLNRFHVHAHLFRHTFITELIRNNHDLAIVKSLSGHSSMESLGIYSQPKEIDIINAVNGIYVG